MQLSFLGPLLDRRGPWRLLDVVEAHNAPDLVLEAARELPESGECANVNEVVKALRGEPTG
ncbi:hypothetical protein ACWGJT_15160 [Streptomyces xantholiticus]